jgi:hypothetical protein
VGIDGSLYRSARYYFIPLLNLSHSELWYCNKEFLRLFVVRNELSIVSLYSLLNPGCKIVECFEFSLGVCLTGLSGLVHFQGT